MLGELSQSQAGDMHHPPIKRAKVITDRSVLNTKSQPKKMQIFSEGKQP